MMGWELIQIGDGIVDQASIMQQTAHAHFHSACAGLSRTGEGAWRRPLITATPNPNGITIPRCMMRSPSSIAVQAWWMRARCDGTPNLPRHEGPLHPIQRPPPISHDTLHPATITATHNLQRHYCRIIAFLLFPYWPFLR
jgi:hypothetical protein